MTQILLKLKSEINNPIDASMISPDAFQGKSLEEIKNFQMWLGNQKITLGQIFEINGETSEKAEDIFIEIKGDLSKARRIGKKMTSGTIIINGNAGLYLGDSMKGGLIHVNGNTDSWVGIDMKGGKIEIEGDAGDFVGSSYRGSRTGMLNGTILIKGNAGSEIGCWMKDGIIKVDGDVGLYAGTHMQGGTIFIGRNSNGRLGAEMTKGKIILVGKTPDVLPSFVIDEIKSKIKFEQEKISGPFYSFIGDVTENGEGKLFIQVQNNEHLQFKEAFIL